MHEGEDDATHICEDAKPCLLSTALSLRHNRRTSPPTSHVLSRRCTPLSAEGWRSRNLQPPSSPDRSPLFAWALLTKTLKRGERGERG